jgi:hypothetical protein
MKIVDPTLKTVSNYKHVNLRLDCNIFFSGVMVFVH